MPILPGTSLAAGQLAAAKATLLLASRYTEISFFSLTNAGGSTETILLYIKRSGDSSRRIPAPTLATGEMAYICRGREVIYLSPGDTLEGATTNATSVDYFISGTET